MSRQTLRRTSVYVACISVLFPPEVYAQNASSANNYGLPGHIEMPSARSFDDAELISSATINQGQQKYALTFQITPRLAGVFRYSIIDDFGSRDIELFDRSFDLHYQVVHESELIPGVAVGLRDFIGTGVYSGEYIVASKQFMSQITGTAGIGWGSLGSVNSFDNPLSRLDARFDTREQFTGLGGELNSTQWFRGEAAAFAGLSWQLGDKLTLNAEYSSDDSADIRRVSQNDNAERTALNFGLNYRPRPGLTIGAHYLQGETLGATAQFALNPTRPLQGGDTSPAPIPFASRDGSARKWAGPVIQDAIPESLRTQALAAGLIEDGLILGAIRLSETTVLVQIQNNRFDSTAQAIGRTSRLLSLIMPAQITQFDIEITQNGVALSRVTLQRRDLEQAEYTADFVTNSLAATQIGAAQSSKDLTFLNNPRLSWGLGPYLGLSYFDPDNPLRADLGLELTARYDLTNTLSVSSALRAKVVGNRDSSQRESDSILPRVRSEQPLYDRDGAYGIERLTLDHFGQLGGNTYTRASLGYFEQMFAGVSGEVLWKPVKSRLAFGVEVNHVLQRDTDKLFGFGDYNYNVTTGHISGYYAFENGFDIQVDIGRYLAGDFGATLSIDRRFGNGWVVGAFATLTDVSFEDFGEGSFDKGIRISVPLAWALGRPNRNSADLTLRSIQRDGGARVDIDNRLYSSVREAHAPELSDQWGRFWR